MSDDPSLTEVVLDLRAGALALGDRTLWSGLDLQIRSGEFVAVLGANGSGKTSLLKAILGLQPLTSGVLTIAGRQPQRGSELIGYIPQERRLAPPTPLRVRDLVRLGIDGQRWGFGWPNRGRGERVEEILRSVGASHLADVPVHLLSGGEQQRVRIAQSLATDPKLLLCDEPLLSLDLSHQRAVVTLIDQRRRSRGTAVLFVTHEINPVLPYVDRVLYLAEGRFRIGTVDEVMTSRSLSALYGTEIEVLRSGSRIIVAGIPDVPEHEHEHEQATTNGLELPL
ncbi:MAG: zinc/manganese transport system ATP-binding protein [Pseudonocardiales bacterium]|nr:zinc/manganese transport system ATP-binding protein [Pseudonocardiales bacterium]